MANRDVIIKQAVKNLFMTVGLFSLTMGLTWLALSLIWGGLAAFVLLAGGVLYIYWRAQKTAGGDVLREMGGRPIAHSAAPELYSLLAGLAKQAQLDTVPKLYLLPGGMQNALTTGGGVNAAIGITEGLLNRLNIREVHAVLAHEVSHIRNNDLLWLGASNVLTHFTRTLAVFGQIVFIFLLPLSLFGQYNLWNIFLFMILLNFLPLVSAILALALSRTREYQADLTAVSLTGDPAALASALQKIETDASPWWQKILGDFGRAKTQPRDIWRSHPITKDRIHRLRQMTVPAGARANHGPADFSYLWD